MGKEDDMEHDDDKIERFLEAIFGPQDERPAVKRNPGCRFTEKVIEYLDREWSLDLIEAPVELQDQVIDMIDELKGKENVPNACAKIMESIG